MDSRQFQASNMSRALATLLLLFWYGALIGWWLGERPPAWWYFVLHLVYTPFWTVYAVDQWRWRIVVSDDGITVRPGIGRTRHVPWDRVASIRRGRWWSSWRLEVRDDEDIRLSGLAGPEPTAHQLREVEQAIRRARPGAAHREVGESMRRQQRWVGTAFAVALITLAVLAVLTGNVVFIVLSLLLAFGVLIAHYQEWQARRRSRQRRAFGEL